MKIEETGLRLDANFRWLITIFVDLLLPVAEIPALDFGKTRHCPTPMQLVTFLVAQSSKHVLLMMFDAYQKMVVVQNSSQRRMNYVMLERV